MVYVNARRWFSVSKHCEFLDIKLPRCVTLCTSIELEGHYRQGLRVDTLRGIQNGQDTVCVAGQRRGLVLAFSEGSLTTSKDSSIGDCIRILILEPQDFTTEY